MQTLARGDYTEAQVLAALRGVTGTRKMDFRYQILDESNQLVDYTDAVSSASISYDGLADIKRTAQFEIVDDGSIDFLRHRLRPMARLYIDGPGLGAVGTPGPSISADYDTAVARVQEMVARWRFDETSGLVANDEVGSADFQFKLFAEGSEGGEEIPPPTGGGDTLYAAQFDDGHPFPVCGTGTTVVNVSTSSGLSSALSSLAPGHKVVLADGSYTINTTITTQASLANGISIVAANRNKATFSSGSRITFNNAKHITMEGLAFPNDAAGDVVVVTGNSEFINIHRNLFGPVASQGPSSTSGNYIYVAGTAHDIRISFNELRWKARAGNGIRVYGSDFTSSPTNFSGCKHILIEHNYLHDFGPQVSNDLEPIRFGVSSMSMTPSHSAIIRNVLVRCQSEPEKISIKMSDVWAWGNCTYDCAGSITSRHGKRNKLLDNYVDGGNVTASDGLKAGGLRWYDEDIEVAFNYVRRSNGAVAGYENPITIDGGESGTALNRHVPLVDSVVNRNVVVDSVGRLDVGSNYSIPPDGLTLTNNLVANSSGTGGTSPYLLHMTPTGTFTNSGNQYGTTPAAVGLVADADGIYRRDGYGPRLKRLAITDVGPNGDLTELDGTGLTVGSTSGGGGGGGGGGGTGDPVALTLVAATNWVFGSVNPVITYPGGMLEGDMIYMVVHNKPSSVTPTTLSGWTLINTGTGGGGSDGDGTGLTRWTVFRRAVPAGGLSGTFGDGINTGGNGVGVSLRVYRGPAGAVYEDELVVRYSISTASTAISGTANDDLDLDVNDRVVVLVGTTDDTTTTITVSALAATGATFTLARSPDTAAATSSIGNDQSVISYEGTVTAGTSTTAPTVTATTNAAETAHVALLRVRATVPVETEPGVEWVDPVVLDGGRAARIFDPLGGIATGGGGSLTGASALTFVGWVRLSSVDDTGSILYSTGGNGFSVDIDQVSNNLSVTFSLGGVDTTVEAPSNTLSTDRTMLGFTWQSGGPVVLYLNGAEVGRSANTGIGSLSDVGDLVLGDGYPGDVDDFLLAKQAAGLSIMYDIYANGLQIGPATPPTPEDRGYVEWPQGVFLLSSPTRKADENGAVTRDVDAYDLGWLLESAKTSEAYYVAAGALYTDAVKELLDDTPGVVDYQITPSAATLPAQKVWEPGTSHGRIIQDLVAAISYEALFFDEDGVAILQPYIAPQDRTPSYSYAADEVSVLIPGATQTLDLFAQPNRWTLVVSEPDRTMLTATFTNDDPASPTSTVNRGYVVADVRTETEAADQAALNAKVERIAQEATEVFETIEFSTALMPIHGHRDMVHVSYPDLGFHADVSETKWSYTLEAGAKMAHSARRVVKLDGSLT